MTKRRDLRRKMTPHRMTDAEKTVRAGEMAVGLITAMRIGDIPTYSRFAQGSVAGMDSFEALEVVGQVLAILSAVLNDLRAQSPENEEWMTRAIENIKREAQTFGADS